MLGLPDRPTVDQVTRAFRAAAKLAHPDHGGDPRSYHLVDRAYRTALAAARAAASARTISHERYRQMADSSTAATPSGGRRGAAASPPRSFAQVLQRQMARQGMAWA